MGGLLVLFVATAYLWLTYKAVRLTPWIWGKLLVVLVAVLIPTADAIYGRMTFNDVCTRESGLKLYQVVQGVEGLYAPREFYDVWIKEYGYKFVEGDNVQPAHGAFARLTRGPDGTVRSETSDSRLAAFAIKYQAEDDGVYLRESEEIRELRTGSVLGKYTQITYFGGWLERALSRVSAGRWSVDVCPRDRHYEAVVELVTRTLIPSN